MKEPVVSAEKGKWTGPRCVGWGWGDSRAHRNCVASVCGAAIVKLRGLSMSLNRKASERGVRLHACEPPARTKAVYSGLHLMWCLHLRCCERPAVHPRRELLRSAHWTSQRFPDPEGQYLRPLKRMCSRASPHVISPAAPCIALTGSSCARRLPLLQRRAPRLGPLGSPAAP
jgi:hypothetical protein